MAAQTAKASTEQIALSMQSEEDKEAEVLKELTEQVRATSRKVEEERKTATDAKAMALGLCKLHPCIYFSSMSKGLMCEGESILHRLLEHFRSLHMRS